MLYKNKYRNESIRLKNYDYSQKGLYFITICTQHRECMFGYIDNGKMTLNDAGVMLGKWYLEMDNKYPNFHCGEYVTMPNHFHCIIEIFDNMNTNNCIPDAYDRNRIISNENTDAHDRNRIISNENTDAHDRNRIISNENTDAHDRNRIISNENTDAHVGAPLRGRPSPEKRVDPGSRGRPSPEKRVDPGSRGRPSPEKRGCATESYGPNNKKFNATIPLMVNWFKTMTTNEYIRGVKKYNWSRYDRKLWQKNYWDHIIRSETELIRIKKYIKNNPGKWELDKLKSRVVK